MASRSLRIFGLLAISFGSVSATDDRDGFKSLVSGDDAAQFALIGINPDTITLKDGEIRLTGKPNGYFATKASYKNYVLEFEWMYERPDGYKDGDRFDGNSGLLVHISGEHKVWPKCVEAQLANSDAGNLFAINGAKFTGKKDAPAQKGAIKPVGQWNKEIVTCKDGAIACVINGVEVAKGTGATPAEGPIGWQSEGSPIRFRNLRIKVLD